MPKKTAKNRKKRLSPKQLRAAGLLADGDRYIVVAEKLSVSADTLRRWRESPEFRLKVEELQSIQSEEIAFAIRANAQQVADNLRLAIATCQEIMSAQEVRKNKEGGEVLDDCGQPVLDYKYQGHVRLSAARTAIEASTKLLPNIKPPDTIEVAAAAKPDFSPERLQDIREKIYGIF